MEPSLPIGVYQIDPDGVVLGHVSVATGVVGPSRAVGRHFFEEVAPSANSEVFRGRFERLSRRGAGTESFDYRLWDVWQNAVVRVRMVGTPRGVWVLIAEPSLCERYAESRLEALQ